MSVLPYYANWPRYAALLAAHVRRLSAEDLALRPTGGDHWPIWAIVAHTAGARVYWLCSVLGEPGAETTPFTDPTGLGWEDDLARPRSAAELGDALDSTWAVVAGCLDRWTPAMLGETVRRQGGSGPQVHTRQSILLRMINHDAYHLGEVNLILGANGRETIDPWPSADWLESAPVARREG